MKKKDATIFIKIETDNWLVSDLKVVSTPQRDIQGEKNYRNYKKTFTYDIGNSLMNWDKDYNLTTILLVLALSYPLDNNCIHMGNVINELKKIDEFKEELENFEKKFKSD